MRPLTSRETTQSSRWRLFGVTFSFIATMMTLWALATPLMASPDEPAHAIRAAAVARGQITAPPSTEVPWQLDVQVPRYIANTPALPCFAFNPQESAACQVELSGDPDEIVAAPTSAGLNSPIYYALVGWPTLVLSGDVALYAMRIMSALVSAALFAFATMSLSQLGGGRWKLFAAIATLTPMLLFLGASINPNAVEITAAAALFASLTLMLSKSSTPRLLWERAGIVMVSAVLLVNTRSIALLWLALIVAGAFMLSDKQILRQLLRRTASWVALGVAAIGCFAALYWFTRPAPVVPDEALPAAPGIGGGFLSGAQFMLDQTLDFAKAWIGLFGWVDQGAPELAFLVWTVILSGIVLAAIFFARGSARLVTIMFALSALMVPPISQGILLADYGFIWQGRYMMAIYTCLIMSAGIALDNAALSSRVAVPRNIVTSAVWAMAVAHLLTFAWVLRRYVIGGGTWSEMIQAPEWQPPGTWLGLSALFALTLAAATLAANRALRRSELAEHTSVDEHDRISERAISH